MLTFRGRSWGVPIGAAIALLVISCSESKVSQCNRLAEVVNKAQGFMPAFESDIQAFSTNAAQVQSLDDIKAAADQYVAAVDSVVGNLDSLVTELGAIELTDEQLIEYRDGYIGMVEGFSSALNQASDAMNLVQAVEDDSELPAKIEESQQETVKAVQLIQDLSVQEASIINEVNTYCGADGQPSAPAPDSPEGE
ncbi:MAG: hypothetical protein AAFX01_07235 [Cyanobacteria bacterium J06638_28]